MALKRTYGTVEYCACKDSETESPHFLMTGAEPQVCILLKNVFPKLSKSDIDEFKFGITEENCINILWFIQRYPMKISPYTVKKLTEGKVAFIKRANDLEKIITGKYIKRKVSLNEGFVARDYQIKAAEIMLRTERMILGDEMGTGKSLCALLCLMYEKSALPALIVCQSHVTVQWRRDVIQKFTDMTSFIITGHTPFKLPAVDVYIINYHCLAKWVSVFPGIVNAVIFDECQELRKTESEKYRSAYNLCNRVKFAWGLSGTPIYNFGDEIYNILSCLKNFCLGTEAEFRREWCGETWRNSIENPKALGAYLREKFLMLRRTAKEIGRELPQINTIVQTVVHDEQIAKDSEDLARELALSYLTASGFMEKGQIGRELDMRVRQSTGVAKAASVAAMVRMLLESGEPVLLSGWHREVYEIWMSQLAEFNPVMYTGSESLKQKEEAKLAFIEGRTDLFIISNRSGVGLDGLQYRCRYVVIGELDYSPKVHDQIIARTNRDGQEHQVTVIYPICEYGSDPTLVNLLGLKSQQSHYILDPKDDIISQHTDENRIRLIAESFLKKNPATSEEKQVILDKIDELVAQEKYEEATRLRELLKKY